MKTEIFFGHVCGQNAAITVEDGKIVDLDFDSDENRNIVGNVYKGRVTNVLSGMQAAFVNCGLEKNCYLSTDTSYTDTSRYQGGNMEGEPKTTTLDLKVGDEIMVQLVKPPRGDKGAKVTTKISYVGEHLIYIPRDSFMGVSRKIYDDELRENLLFMMEKLRAKREGIIVRTAAPTVDRKVLKKELEWFRRIDKDVIERFKTAKVGDIICSDGDLFSRTIRDHYSNKISGIYVADQYHYDLLRETLLLASDGSEKKLHFYRGERDMLVKYNLIDQIIGALKPTVPLPSGGNIVIEKTEALNVIDVNTGKYIGKENLEDTVFRTNLEAAREIARQVRLRNLGGIVVVDFIDMTDEEHKRTVTATLEEALMHDKSKCHVLPMSDFCVVEFTRKRVNHDVAGMETRRCPHCNGAGYILSDSFIAIKIRGDISDHFADGYNAVVVELNRGVMESILQHRWFSSFVSGKWKNKRVYMVPHRTYLEDHYTIRGDNSGVLHLPDDAQILY